MQKRAGVTRKSRNNGTGWPSGLKLLRTGSSDTRTSTINKNVYNSVHSLFADWRIIVLPVGSFPGEGVIEVKGLEDSLYISL